MDVKTLKRQKLEARKERVRQQQAETAALNADASVWSHAELERAKRGTVALRNDLAKKAIEMQIEPEAEDFK